MQILETGFLAGISDCQTDDVSEKPGFFILETGFLAGISDCQTDDVSEKPGFFILETGFLAGISDCQTNDVSEKPGFFILETGFLAAFAQARVCISLIAKPTIFQRNKGDLSGFRSNKERCDMMSA